MGSEGVHEGGIGSGLNHRQVARRVSYRRSPAVVAVACRASIQLRGARSQRNLNKQIRGVSRMRAPSGATGELRDKLYVVRTYDLRSHRLRRRACRANGRPKTGQVVVGYGSGALAILDPVRRASSEP